MPILPKPVFAPRIPCPTIVAATLLAAASAGCYTHDGLVAKAQKKAIRTRIDEVELGAFRVTLPRDPERNELTEIDMRLFGETERYKINEIEHELETLAPLFEDRTMRVLREIDRRLLAEPELKELRKRLLTAFNEMLTDAPLRAIGFYDVRFIRH